MINYIMKLLYLLSITLCFQIAYAQSSHSSQCSLTQEKISFALLDLGFTGRLISLSLKPTYVDLKVNKPVKMSSRTLEEILSSLEEKAEKENFKKSISTFNYHLIAGCFSSLENAQDYVLELIDKGYNSSIIGKTLTGLHMVNFNSYYRKKEASIEAEKLNSIGIDAWIKKI